MFLENYLSNAKNIESHAFYPLINRNITLTKFNYSGRQSKNREIYYSAHLDRYVYQYYSLIFNNALDNYLNTKKCSKVSCAYRLNKGWSNITIAKEVFEFIKNRK